GAISIRGIHEDPVVDGDLAIDDLLVENGSVGPVRAALHADRGKCGGSIEAGRAAARATARVSAGCAWKDATIPHLDPNVALDASLDMNRFPIAAIGTALGDSVLHPGGFLDAHFRAEGRPRAGELAVRGTARLDRGRGLVLAVGRQFEDVRI